jgi:sigma-B regulation protein RsbU (phosphoserine phosphatase)
MLTCRRWAGGMGVCSIPAGGGRAEDCLEENGRAQARAGGGSDVRVLIAHGDAGSRHALREVAHDLSALGLDPVESGDGGQAVELLLGDDAPGLAVVDWDLPGVDGPELCRRVKAGRSRGKPYIILLAPSEDQVGEAFAAGADDCVLAGAGEDELLARLFAARRLGVLRTARFGVV